MLFENYDYFVINGDGTVTDTSTGLMWQQATDGYIGIMSWKEALAYCQNLDLGGHKDWRLPTIKELRSIVDYTRTESAININIFINTLSSQYLSGSTFPSNVSFAWGVGFSVGGDGYSNKDDDLGYVRAVRGGQSGAFGDLVITGFASTITPDSVILNGTVNPNGVATNYYFEYGTTTNYGYSTDIQSAGSGTTATPVTAKLTGLTQNTTYHFRLVGQNSNGTKQGSDETFTTFGAPKDVVTGSASAVTSGSATLGGTLNPNGTTTTYWFEYGRTTAYGSATQSQTAAAGTTAAAVSGSLTGLTQSMTYHFRLVAQNSAGTTKGEDAQFTTLYSLILMPVATTFAANDITMSSAKLNASINPNGSATTYWFEYGPSTSTGYDSKTEEKTLPTGSQIKNVEAVISGLSSNTQYVFRIVAKNDAGTITGSPMNFKTAPSTTPPDIKVIIVAGGGPTGNNIWDATVKCANAAYKALRSQGITKDRIWYLNHEAQPDLDGNGQPDEVNGKPTNAGLESAIKSFSVGANDLLLYMVDHGGPGKFMMGKNEILYATDLNSWLDVAQSTISGKEIIVYDACHSGSFISALKPPVGKEGQRIIAASTQTDSLAWFVTEGTLSFSWLFWNNVANGYKFYDAYVNAKKAMGLSFKQYAMIEADGNGTADEKDDKRLASDIHICLESGTAAPAPEIGSICAAQTIPVTQGKATIYVDNVSSVGGSQVINRVWAVITPPGFTDSQNTQNPVTDAEIPPVYMNDKGNGRYSVDYNYFNREGIYNIAVFAIDTLGYVSEPKITTVTVGDVTIKPDKYEILTDSSPACTVESGAYVRIFGSSGVNTVNVKSAARVECVNFPGANQINIEESSFQCKIKRSGATVYITGDSTMSIKIPATKTAQTLRFGDGSATLVITGGRVMLGTQEITTVETAIRN